MALVAGNRKTRVYTLPSNFFPAKIKDFKN